MGSLSLLESLCVEISLVVQLCDLTVDGLDIRSELSQLRSEKIDLLREAIIISGSLVSCSFSIGHTGGESGNFGVEGALGVAKGGQLSPSVGLEIVPKLRQDAENFVVLSF